MFPRRDIPSGNHPSEHLQGQLRLIKRHFMTALIHAYERKLTRLSNLAVHYPVRRAYVRVPCLLEPGRVDGDSDGFAAEPVAVVICVAGVHDYGDILGEERSDVLCGVGASTIVAGGREGEVDGVVALGEIDVGADSGLDGRGVEVVDVEGVWEGVRDEFAEVVLVSTEVVVVDGFDVVSTEGVCGAADFVDGGVGGAVEELVKTVAGAVEVVVEEGGDGGVVGEVVVCVSGVDLVMVRSNKY